MILLISPAKTLDFSPVKIGCLASVPRLINDANLLAKEVQMLDKNSLGKLMSLSENLSQLNYNRFQDWTDDESAVGKKEALYAFKGDVYTGIDVENLSSAAQDFLHEHLRILSGLYGLLRPLDNILPYRLEMGTKFQNSRGKHLYDFWDNSITELLADDLSKDDGVLVNLASNEYFKAVKTQMLAGTKIITPVFKDEKNGVFKVVSFFAKKARGLMCRYVAENAIFDPEELKAFDSEGYFFNGDLSSENEWVFTRFGK